MEACDYIEDQYKPFDKAKFIDWVVKQDDRAGLREELEALLPEELPTE